MSAIDRIVVIHDSIEARGGATGLARLSASQYRHAGHEVTFITGAVRDPALEAAGIDIVGLDEKAAMTSSTGKAMIKGLHNFSASRAVAAWIRENDTPGTVYHLHNWAHVLSPAVFTALREVETRTVVSCHDFFNVCPNGGLLNFPKGEACTLKPMSAACWASQCDRRSTVQKYWRMLRHLNLHRTARFGRSGMAFVCLHKGMEAIMRDAGFAARDLTSIANPAIAYSETRIEAERNAGFMFVGRLNREKGADIAVDAASRAGVPITMIGEGDLSDELQAAYPDAHFAGFCDRAQIEAYARKSRAIVVPGRWREPYGLVIAEAAMSGLPVLISDPSTLSGQIADHQMGAAFDPHDGDALAGLMSSLTRDDTLTAYYSHNAFEKADQICSTPAGWAAQFVTLFEQRLALAK